MPRDSKGRIFRTDDDHRHPNAEPEIIVAVDFGKERPQSDGVPQAEKDRITAIVAERKEEAAVAAEYLQEHKLEQREARAQAISDAREQRRALEEVARAAWIEAGGEERAFAFRYSVIHKRFLDDAVVAAMLEHLSTTAT